MCARAYVYVRVCACVCVCVCVSVCLSVCLHPSLSLSLSLSLSSSVCLSIYPSIHPSKRVLVCYIYFSSVATLLSIFAYALVRNFMIYQAFVERDSHGKPHDRTVSSSPHFENRNVTSVYKESIRIVSCAAASHVLLLSTGQGR